MCGIVAVSGDPDERLVREMMDRIAHRGPDGSGFQLDFEGHSALARIIHEGPTAAAHLRALAEEIGVRLLDVG